MAAKSSSKAQDTTSNSEHKRSQVYHTNPIMRGGFKLKETHDSKVLILKQVGLGHPSLRFHEPVKSFVLETWPTTPSHITTICCHLHLLFYHIFIHTYFAIKQI